MKKVILTGLVIIFANQVSAQSTTATNTWAPGRFIGYTGANPLDIRTNNTLRAQFTTGNALTSLVGNSGDGLRIFPIPNQSGSLDLFTSGNNGQNETHIVFGASGQISGQRNRFEFLSKANQGFWFDLINSNQYYKFATNATVHAFVGNNRFWRIGDQGETSNINASRRLEVVQNDWQFRLSRTNGIYTDFQTNANGNLQILPQGGSVGINLNANPTANLDVNGNARIRNVQAATPNSILVGVNANGSSDVNVRRLDFNGNPNTFLSGNGTFQTINTTPIPADNGVSRFTLFDPNAPYQLGDVYSNFFVSNTPLTANRQVRLNGNNLIFSGSGNVGIGLSYPTLPTEVLDVNGNARFHNVPSQGGQSLILGLQNGANTNDVELSRLAFPNDNSQVLLGNGTWGAAPTSGVGNYCGATQNPLLANYEVPLNDNN